MRAGRRGAVVGGGWAVAEVLPTSPEYLCCVAGVRAAGGCSGGLVLWPGRRPRYRRLAAWAQARGMLAAIVSRRWRPVRRRGQEHRRPAGTAARKHVPARRRHTVPAGVPALTLSQAERLNGGPTSPSTCSGWLAARRAWRSARCVHRPGRRQRPSPRPPASLDERQSPAPSKPRSCPEPERQTTRPAPTHRCAARSSPADPDGA